jgi:hypothetical protein
MGFFGEIKNSGVRSPRPKYHRHNPAGDQVPVLIEMDWNDGLNVENVLGVVEFSDAKVCVVLEWHTDQIGDGVLSGLAKVISCQSGQCRTNRSRSRNREHKGNFRNVTHHTTLRLAKIRSR